MYILNVYIFLQTLSHAAKKELSELMDQPCAQPFIEPVDLEVYSVSSILYRLLMVDRVITGMRL